MNRRCRQTILLCATLALAASADRSSAAAVDESSLTKAEALYKAGKLVEAEELLVAVLAAIDDGTLAQRNLGRCAKTLADVYRRRGRYDDALKLALRHRGLLSRQSGLSAAERRRLLAKNAAQLADIYTALGEYKEAEKHLQSLLPPEGADTRRDPVTPLIVRVKLARLAEAQQDDAKAKTHWNEVYHESRDAIRNIEEGKIDAKHRTNCVAALVAAYVAAEKVTEAIGVKVWLLAHQDRDGDPLPAIKTRMEIGILYDETRQYSRAKDYFDQALDAERKRAANGLNEAELLDKLGGVSKGLGQRKEANERWIEAAAIYATALRRADSPQQINLLGRMLSVYQQAGQFDKAIQAGVRLLAMQKQRDGENHPNTYTVKSRLGALYGARGRYEQAQPLLSEALDAWRAHQPPQPAKLALALNDMAFVERAIGSLSHSETLFVEALRIRRKLFKPDDLRRAHSQSNLASVLSAQGKFDLAVVYHHRAIANYRSRGKEAEDSLSTALLNLSRTYKSQGQLGQAARYCGAALKVYEHAFGVGKPGSVAYYNALTALSMYRSERRLKLAEQNNRRAIAICLKNNMQSESVYATALHHQAQIAYLRDQFVDARKHWRQALAVQRAMGNSSHVARSLIFLARIEQLQDHPEAAEPLYREALSYDATLTVHYLARTNLADILRNQGKIEDAIDLLDKTVRLIEAPRRAVTGAEGERAEHFSLFATAQGEHLSPFDLLIDLKLASGQLDKAFQFAEQRSNRTFLDQLSLAGIDLRTTLTAEDAAKLLPREKSLRVKIATLRADAIASLRRGNMDEAQRKRVSKALDKLQSQYADVWKEIRGASPMYRALRKQGSSLASLAAVREHLAETQGVMLFYYVGSSGAHLLVIGPDEADDETVKLNIPGELAGQLEVDEGSLTRSKTVKLVNTYLADLRDRRGGTRGGIKSDGSEAPPSKGLNVPKAAVKRGLDGTVYSEKGYLAADSGVELAEVFVPRRVRQIVERQKARSVVIVPDGALHQLPFEALLLSREPQRKYLLDEFPPITYAPSASILLGLMKRGSSTSEVVAALSVGDPQYKLEGAEELPGSLAGTSRDAYFSLGGQLPALPGTDLECSKVQAALGKDRVTVLRSAEATEANVRTAIAGKRFVHLAAHGLVDQKHDNLFGAIALTVPEGNFDNGENDGFLSLAEIHRLPLGDCEVAVLSACQTNVGPDRPLEAASTLAQGFLIAGARRVVCSHWSVDDASTAEMMGTFFDAIATELRRDAGVDYAAALHAARKRIRGDPRWSAPYFWAPFVLLGPAADHDFIADLKRNPTRAHVVEKIPSVPLPAPGDKLLLPPSADPATSRYVTPQPTAVAADTPTDKLGWKFWALCGAGALAVVSLAVLSLRIVRKKR